jgi:hypothetical protein
LLLEPYYRGFGIEIAAVAADGQPRGRWHADVRIRHTLTEDKPHVERITCYKLTPDRAEHAGELWAKRWFDLKGGA